MTLQLSHARHVAASAAALLIASTALAATTDLATAPLETSTGTLVKPNILYVLDNSGSMVWDFMPDWAGAYANFPWLVRNSRFNGVYYDPAITYTPPLKYDGSGYDPMTTVKTTGWTKVPYDGFGVMNTGNIPNTGTSNLFTNSGSGDEQNLTAIASYYTFVPGEYCASPNLRNCSTQNSATTANPYPAYLRWCANANLTNCQASRIDSGNAPVTYIYPRYPGAGATSTLTVSGLLLFSISSITVNGTQILSAATPALNFSASATASSVANNINACTMVRTGNCTTTGYSAVANNNVVTIFPPGDGLAGVTPAVIGTGSATAFTSGAPGRYVLTSILPAAGTPYPKATSRTDCASSAGCTYTEEMTNYANWWAYYRTRMQTMKSASTIAFNALNARYRLGYMSINDNPGTVDFLNVAENTTALNGQKWQWYDRLITALPNGGTPLRYALSQAGQYYGGKLSTINGVSATDPMEYACQRNYTLLSTDGYWSASTAATSVGATLTGATMGDTDSREMRPYLDGTATPNTLADVAQYYWSTDIRDSAFSNTTNAAGTDVSSNAYSNARQNMVTSTIGLGASGYMLYDPDYLNASTGDFADVLNGTAITTTTVNAGQCNWQTGGNCNWPVPVGDTQTTIDDLWHAAVNGRGAYYSATNASDIRSGLTNFLNTVDATTSSSSAVAQSAQVLTAGTTAYTFASTYCSGKWFGDLVRYQINNNATGTTSSTPSWAQSGGGGDCEGTATSTNGTLLQLDNRAFSNRNIFTYNSSNGTSIPFAWDSLPTNMQNYFRMSAISSMSQMCSSGANCLPTASKTDSSSTAPVGAGGLNLVNYLRGERTNEGTNNTKYYRPRTHVLGDIVNSAPVYVQAPNRNYTDTGYSSFKTDKSGRQGMVYVGANDGMLHAFNADTGAETWAYVPSVVMPQMYRLADKNYGANHTYFVDGQITQADVYSGGAWRTILVGGLGGGGRAFYALDVTNPASPTILWEFSSSSTLTPLLNDADLGFSYGAPVVTKLSDGTWVVIVSSGYNNLSSGDGKGHLWVLNAVTGAFIKKIDNGMGGNATDPLITGCSVRPCPSGLTQISAWTDSTTNNLATQVYGGDLYGNLWRFDISTLNGSGGSAPVQLLATLSDPSNVRQPITTTPELGLVSGKHVVYVGTGAYLGLSDVTTTQRQTMYAIKDPLTGSSTTVPIYSNPRSNICTGTTNTNCFVSLTLTDTAGRRTVSSSVSYRANFSNMNGWFSDMPTAGERIDVDPVLQSGTLVYVSNTPGISGACSTGGTSYINFVNYSTGLPVSGNYVGQQLSNTGLSSAATLAITASGKIVATTKDSSGKVSTTEIPTAPSSSGTRRISWRRLTN